MEREAEAEAEPQAQAQAQAAGSFSLAACEAALERLLRGRRSAPAPGRAWFKESSARNLRRRDFIAPRGALGKLFPRGQVPENVMQGFSSDQCQGLHIQSCEQTDAGLLIQLDHTALFTDVLSNVAQYTRSSASALVEKKGVVLNCAVLQGCRGLESLTVGHLRAILLTDHLAELLRQRGYTVHMTPSVAQNTDIWNFLKLLSVKWLSSWHGPSSEGTVSDFKRILRESVYTELGKSEDLSSQGHKASPKDVLFKVHLKEFVKEKGLEGYDPNLDVALVQEGSLRQVAELQNATAQCQEAAEHCTVIHVVGCEEDFQQQKIDLLWQILNTGRDPLTQKYVVCGPVRVTGENPRISAIQYFQFRRSQMKEASVMKYGDLVQGDSWTGIISSMTSATIRFELLAAAHRSPLTLDLSEEASISTKGTRSGAFVMYNCARLATLFDNFHKSVQQELYPELPDTSELNFSALREEGEWLLLYNYIIPFPEVLSESAKSWSSSEGIRLTVNTEAICKFLVKLSMDFSSYYNRVHILGEPLDHLFNQMFARLWLMKALRDVFHTALGTLHILPPNQL
ncbi:DALR anticodon-binding domain-containing protein 3 [Callorhinchus milii]|uniref:DALR anticodon-binding domain-containing protein 3 n=1 Tax=Callorhinchus milii TaxID=7868 RepID=UPI001C3FC845|nr:DALR anticodon-binding domain-containing protein 3 [Callorhinchus milii]